MQAILFTHVYKHTRKKMLLLAVCISLIVTAKATDSTYAEKLGFPKGAKVVILHVDDAGMSYESNEGAILALTKGVATSTSVMMPCSWVPGFVQFLKEHPQIDAGLHLTLTAEWKNYRWGPLSGKPATQGLVDQQGCLWPNVADVVQHASAAEVATEINAQLQRALTMGFTPTHVDTHMGTLLATPAFAEQYIQLGIKNHIPVMLPSGHATLIALQMHASQQLMAQMHFMGNLLWKAGLPVLDDLYNESYDWVNPTNTLQNDSLLQAYRTNRYIAALDSLQPGITMVIMHCTATTPQFKYISDSGPTRRGDLLAMLDPRLKAYIQEKGIILTTWRELMQRRSKLP
ncbi:MULTISPECIES: polysaccharide deacetylase family protein [unclassified Hydrotalea]|uniref:polysaccharide deacetylase family protein n=1 Tax=unclassified Hydrotalea TaxID=2643788 RepID=UPI0009C134D0|nr:MULTISPECIES: polysaccharide deacetylase family protein [unclassified Hydrotalea]